MLFWCLLSLFLSDSFVEFVKHNTCKRRLVTVARTNYENRIIARHFVQHINCTQRAFYCSTFDGRITWKKYEALWFAWYSGISLISTTNEISNDTIYFECVKLLRNNIAQFSKRRLFETNIYAIYLEQELLELFAIQRFVRAFNSKVMSELRLNQCKI